MVLHCYSLQYESAEGEDGALPALDPPRPDAAWARRVVPLVVSVRDEAGRTVGGLMASTYGEWLLTQMVWLPEGARHQGYGRRLLALAETEALRRGCRHAHVESCCSVHRPFFERCGYGAPVDLPGFLSGTAQGLGLAKPLE